MSKKKIYLETIKWQNWSREEKATIEEQLKKLEKIGLMEYAIDKSCLMWNNATFGKKVMIVSSLVGYFGLVGGLIYIIVQEYKMS